MDQGWAGRRIWVVASTSAEVDWRIGAAAVAAAAEVPVAAMVVGAAAGPLIPIGRAGWTTADLAASIDAPVLVVTAAGPDAVNHTTLMLGALTGRGVAASVITIGDVDEEALPVTPAGRIPADPASDGEIRLDPFLRTKAGPSAGPDPAAVSRPKLTSGTRIVLALLAVFVLMVLAVCGAAWAGRTPESGNRHGAGTHGVSRLGTVTAWSTPAKS